MPDEIYSTIDAVKQLARREAIKLLYALIEEDISIESILTMSLKEFTELCERIIKKYAI